MLRSLISRSGSRVRGAIGIDALASMVAGASSLMAQIARDQETRASERHTELMTQSQRAGSAPSGNAVQSLPQTRATTFTTPQGVPYRLLVDNSTDDPYRSAVTANGAQEDDWLFCLSWLRPGDVFLDIGANVGVFTIPASVLGVEVHAFELLADNVGRIIDGLALNPAGKVRVTLGAVWDRAGVVGYAGHSAWGTISLGAQAQIAALRLDDYIEQQSVSCVDMIKLDVEGAERSALLGANTTITRDHPDILIEANSLTCGGFGYSYRTLLDNLWSHGYRLFRIGKHRLHPVTPNSVQEIVQTDYLATTKSDVEIFSRNQWPICIMTDAEQVDSIKKEERHGLVHHMHVVAVSGQLPAAVRDHPDVNRLLDTWQAHRQAPEMDRLRTGTAAV